MIFGWSRSVKSLAHQARGVRRLHVFGGFAVGFIALAVLLSTIFGSILFNDKSEAKSASRELLSFNEVDENSPIPLLLRHSPASAPRVKVKGETITKSIDPIENEFTPNTTLSDNYIRAFAFETTANEFGVSISVSWNVKASSGRTLYIVSETNSTRTSEKDNDIYSIDGEKLERISQNFQVDSIKKSLYLKVYRLNETGVYEIVDTSPVISVMD